MPWANAKQRSAELYRGALCALVSLGIPMNLHGFDYLLSAIMLTAEDPSYVQDVTVRLYPKIAEEYDVKLCRIERNMRTAIEHMFLYKDINILHNYFGNLIDEKSGKVKNAKFIAKVAADVRLDIMSFSLNDARKRVLKELGIESEIPEE